MAGGAPSRLQWHKSSASNGGGECVEVAITGDRVFVRDTKNRAGPVLSFSHAEWKAFIAGVAKGEFTVADSAEA